MRYLLLAASVAVLAACSGQSTDAPTNPATPSSSETATSATETVEETSDSGSSTETTSTDTAATGDWWDAPTPDFYGEGWDVDWGWGGEYPSGFSVIKEGVSVPTHAEPDPDSAIIGSCPVDYRGAYQPWNQARSEKIDARYLTATQMVDYTLASDLEITLYGDGEDNEVTRNFSAGDKIKFKRYIGEGFGQVIVDGEVYQTDLMEFYETASASIENPRTDQWLSLMCNGERAWVSYDEAIAQDGIVSWNPQGYGEAADLTDSELEFELNYDRPGEE